MNATICKYLNDLLKTDQLAITNLILNGKVSCSEQLANHPTCRVSGENVVGMLGILNGMLCELGENCIIVRLNTVSNLIEEFYVSDYVLSKEDQISKEEQNKPVYNFTSSEYKNVNTAEETVRLSRCLGLTMICYIDIPLSSITSRNALAENLNKLYPTPVLI